MSGIRSAAIRPLAAHRIGVQGMRFAVVGVAATLTHAAVVIILMDGIAFPWASVANTLAVVAGSTVSYLGNHWWTFQARSWCPRRVVRFAVAYAAVFAFGGIVMLLASDIAGVPYLLPLAAVLLISPVLTFLLNRYWVFADEA
jgi:putative flippase GtrA